MKEKIYTIPVTDAFKEDCECPICILEKKLEDEYVDYVMGPSLMEPESRLETNDKGFCRQHFEIIYNRQVNRLGLGLVLDTHLVTQNEKFKKLYDSKADALKKDAGISVMKNLSNKLTSKQTETDKLVDALIQELQSLEDQCTICGKMAYTMDRYMEVLLYLWLKEEDFKQLFHSKKGFCLKHFKDLLKGAKKYLHVKDTAIFVEQLMQQQLPHMQRIQEEVNWFTKKFDYRYQDAPWGNSKDAVSRSIQKIVGHCDLK